ncbi:MAG TPA: major capsid protein P2 [Rhizomicrobium sp.]|nr:major capsid protein P2 [Rhizomicrobium sp.]
MRIGRLLRGWLLRPGKETIILPAFQNVAASQTAYLDLPLGFRYHKIHIVYGGTSMTPACITQLRVIINNNICWALSGTQLDTLNQFDKWPAGSTNKVLTIPFELPGLMADHMQKYYTALNTLVPCKATPMGVTALRIEIDINGTPTNPTLASYAEVSDNNPDQGKALLRREVWIENVASTGEYLHVHRYNGDPLRPVLRRVTMWDTSSNITAFRMLVNGQEIHNRLTAINSQIQAGNGDFRSPQNSSFVGWDSEEDGNYANRLKLGNVADFQLRSTHAATNSTLNVVAETLGALPG